MSFHGGLIGVAIAILIYSRKYQISFLGLADFVAPLIPSGLLFGRGLKTFCCVFFLKFSLPDFCCTSAGFLFAIPFLLSILGGSRGDFRARGRNCDSSWSFRCFRGGDVRGSNHIAWSLPWQGIQMLVVLYYSNEIDARLQTHRSTDAFMVVWLVVAFDGLSCTQDGLSLLVVGREQF